ncbi:hypothetical protein N0V90_005783 [Kalmusia sp. IMI 367209]|nr:hypothetical protein N0V90_005783 [Kalmusia sp. IMI 367209]
MDYEQLPKSSPPLGSPPDFTEPEWGNSTGSTNTEVPNDESISTAKPASSEPTPEALAAAAANSPFAQKVRNIDKASKDIERRRNSSAATDLGESIFKAPVRHDSGRVPSDLRPLSLASDADPVFSGFSHDEDLSKRVDEPLVPSNYPFRASFSFQGKANETADLSLLRQRATKGSIEDPSKTRFDAKSPFDAAEPSTWHKLILPRAKRLEGFDFPISRRSRRYFEWCDLYWTPDVVRHTCQDILTLEWTRQLSHIQPASPAFTAAESLANVIYEVDKVDDQRELEVFEFCAGSGGPTPVFERLINQHRRSLGDRPIYFSISDKWPNHEAWKNIENSSAWLTLVNESVDAIDPPQRAMSHGAIRNRRFYDDRVLNVWRSFFLYSMILFVLQWDGIVSCLRTREFDEFLELVQKAAGVEGDIHTQHRRKSTETPCVYQVRQWEIREHEKVLHTLPFGYVRMITGKRAKRN